MTSPIGELTDFIYNSSAPADISHNDSYLTSLLAQPHPIIQIHSDVIISIPIRPLATTTGSARPFAIVGISPDARLISRYEGVPLEIHSSNPNNYNPQQVTYTLSNFTFIHAPPSQKAYSHIIADGSNIGKALQIDNLTVSHFYPLIVDESFKNVPSIYIEDPAGLNVYNLYCFCLNTGGLHINRGYKINLINYKGRTIVNNRPLTLENCAVVTGDVYVESFDEPPLFKNVKWCDKGIEFWSEFPGYSGPLGKPAGYLMELQNCQMALYGQYGQDENSILLDSFSQNNCKFNDLINPMGRLISTSLIGKLNYWPSERATLTENVLVASAFNDDGQQKVIFPFNSPLTNMPSLNYNEGDIFFVEGKVTLSPESARFYIDKCKAKVDLPIFRVNINDTDMGQNIMVNSTGFTFRAVGTALKSGSNPNINLLFYGDKNNQLTTPLKIQFSNVSFWYLAK